MEREIKDYELSEDYRELYSLIHQGYRIPAWIFNEALSDGTPIYDLVEVKMGYDTERYMIGTRGIGYDSFETDIDSFMKDCKRIGLRWIKPNNK